MPFIQAFRQRGDLSFQGMRNTALSLLPTDPMERDRLYRDLKRGTGILDDDDHLNMYLHSFGKMHKAKLDTAFNCVPNAESLFSYEVEIYDWGCGQGTASICLLDFIRAKRINTSNIKSFCLVDPSPVAVNRAKDVIQCYGISSVNLIVKDFDSLVASDFPQSTARKLHLFSNILDVDAFDLAHFTQLFQQVFGGENFFICVGPYYSNNRRVDDFIAATDPDTMFATDNKERGEWLNEWTISLRVFVKNFHRIESVQDIRKRIEESHKKVQFFAGYILDAIAEEYKGTTIEKEAESLYSALSAFDVKSNIPLDDYTECDSKLAVLANIISRGLPTKAPILLENIFSDIYHISQKPDEGAVIDYHTTHTIKAQDIHEALHVIDPRFDVECYNGDMLGSSFEKTFIANFLNRSESEYLIQLLEPQRLLSSIVTIPDRKFSKDQRVDFAFEIPYGDTKTGFILELDGQQYHSNIFQRFRDERRDIMASQGGWDTYRIEHLQNDNFLNNWQTEASSSRYLSIIKSNHAKALTGEWNTTLQAVLTPLAVARIERMLIEAMISGALNVTSEQWNIAVVERDVPCAALAIQDLSDKYSHICQLAGSSNQLPPINLTIISTEEFKSSPLHLTYTPYTQMPQSHFDICLDISMLLRDNIDALPLNVDAEVFFIIRSSHYKKRERVVCAAENIIYQPFVKKDSTGNYVIIKEREELLTYFLQEIFRKPSFRPGQLPILSHSLADKTTIGLLPTGGGKSLTYQLSCILQPGVSIIVDPLVSLMVDQVRGLRDIRIDSCEAVHSGLATEEKRKKLALLQQGATLFMLLSPERFMMENFRDSLITMTEKNHVYFSYGVIDEVHCVSEWGHDFRTSYLHLGRNMINYMKTKSKRPLSVMGLTATASFDVLADVERELTLGGNLSIDSETIVRPENDTRSELSYRIYKVHPSFDELKDPFEQYKLNCESDWDLKGVVAETKKRALVDMFSTIPADIEAVNDPEEPCYIEDFDAENFYLPDSDGKYQNAGILFCPHARGTFGVLTNVWNTRPGISNYLIENVGQLNVGTFVGGDRPSGDMKRFNENEQNLMVATKAFGMGIDKPNVRYTINFNHPSSIESFVQEAGRGGRDRKHAISYILFDNSQYIHLTADKVNDIRYYMGQENDPLWLHNYIHRFILLEDFPDLCRANNATEEQITSLLNIIHNQGFLENVDKNIVLYFHNKSFKGLYKEKVILSELTDRILNVRPSIITEVQGKLREITGNTDVSLKVDNRKNTVKIFSEEENQDQYGYIFLDNLRPNYNYINFDRATCENVSNCLINILQTYHDHSAAGLLQPLDGENNITEGIYQAMEHAALNGYVYVTVTWENQIKQDPEEFEREIKRQITNIAQSHGWKDIDENHYGHLKLSKINDFDELLERISKCSADLRWLQYHAAEDIYRSLKKAFCMKRDKDDTDKAIYRMCCIGLVEDVTIDYLSQTYELKVKKQSDSEFKQHMLDFFRKYYSLEQAQRKVDEIDGQRGRNYLDKCLGYLTGFVYSNLEKKRYRAIEDMRIACEDGYSHRQENNNDDWLKEFIHLYFNSKYARTGYKVNGSDYSLTEDADQEGRDDFDIVKKYIEVIPLDSSSGSEIDNVKHLYGATLLNLRAHPDNAALQLLLSYCIAFQGPGSNEALKANAYNGYVDGFISLYEKNDQSIWELVNDFNDYLKAKAHPDYDVDSLIKEGQDALMLYIHGKKLNAIASKYLQDSYNDSNNSLPNE